MSVNRGKSGWAPPVSVQVGFRGDLGDVRRWCICRAIACRSRRRTSLRPVRLALSLRALTADAVCASDEQAERRRRPRGPARRTRAAHPNNLKPSW